MGGWLAALATLARPVLARVLVALGMSVLTITGVSVVVDNVKSEILFNLGAAPYAALQLAGLAGCWSGLALIFGALTFAVSYWTTTQAVRVLGVAGGGGA